MHNARTNAVHNLPATVAVMEWHRTVVSHTHTIIPTLNVSSPCVRRATHLRDYFFANCKDSGEALSTLNKLTADLLGQATLNLDLCARVEAVNIALGQRLPTLQHLAQSKDDQGNQLSVTSMVSALAAETQLLAGADARSKDTNSNNNGDSSQGALREDAIREALLTSTFADCSAKLEHIDTNSAEGRREAIEAGFLSGNALVAKVLMWGVRDLGRRHPTLALMLDLRGGSTLTGIADYLSYVHAVDPHTGLVPQRAKRYSTVGETGSRDSELKKWLSLKLHDMDWFCPFVGIHALRSMHTGVSPRPLDPRDHLCVISELEDLIEFGERRLASMGVPISLEAGDTGYSWRSFWQFYIQHLKLARRAATHEEMVRWVSQTVTQGKLALRLIGDTLRRYIDSAFPATQQN